MLFRTDIPNEFIEDENIGKHELVVYISLKYLIETKHIMFPDIGMVAKYARIGVTSCVKAMTRLVVLGWIVRSRRFCDTNEYEIKYTLKPF